MTRTLRHFAKTVRRTALRHGLGHVRHRPGITDPGRLGELLRAIEGYTGRGVIGIALKLALLFFVQPGELREARWQQFDLETAQWRIPAECMKARVQHLV